MPLYFAYGSNLLDARLIRRCPGARVVARRATARGWRVDFAKYSWMDGSGKATLAADPNAEAEGVIYMLSGAEMRTLDEIEGVGQGYDRLEGLALTGPEGEVEAFSYIATAPEPGQLPFDWYLALILAGCRQHGLGAATRERFHRQDWVADPEPDRPGHVEARAALQQAGFGSVPDLLGGAGDPG